MKLFVLLYLLCSQTSMGQLLQGTINGTVQDSSQAVVVGAAVNAKSEGTAFSRDTVTNTAGGFSLPDLPPGSYTLTVTAPGFSTQRLTGVPVSPTNVTREEIVLAVGATTDSVTVGAQAVSLQTDRSDVRVELGTRTLANLPVPVGRNYQMLFTTIPGISQPQNANSFTANPSRTMQFSANGGGTATNNIRIDGTSSFDSGAESVSLYSPALEAIETVNVVTNSFDAEQGMAGGAAVQLTVKSGTNAVHGSLFEYHTDRDLAAYPWGANKSLPKSAYNNNQYGGVIGGPIKKDKLFYFGSYEGTRLVQNTPTFLQVPTAAMKLGNLSASPTAIYNPFTGNANGTGRIPFTGNTIPQSMIDPGVQNVLNTGDWTNPNAPGTGALGLGRDLIAGANTGQHRDQYDTKVSYYATSKLTTFVRFGFNNNSYTSAQPFGLLGGPSLGGANTAVGIGFGHIFSGTISATYVFNSNLLMDAYYGYSRNDNSSRPPNLNQNLGTTLMQIPGLLTPGLTGWNQTREGGMPELSIDNYAVLGIPFVTPQDYREPEHEYVLNADWTKGTHNLRMGADLDTQWLADDQEQAPANGGISTGAGGFQFSQGTTQLSGGPAGNDMNSFAAFLLGLPSNAGKIHLFPNEVTGRNIVLGMYFRDRWQVTPKLTVTYGARWEWFPIPIRDSTRGLEFYVPTTNLMEICGIGPNPRNCGITKDTQRVVPRLGIAYKLTDWFVIRAGAGMSNDPSEILSVGPIQERYDFPDYIGQIVPSPNSFSYATTLRQGIPLVTPPNYSSGSALVPLTAGIRTLDNKNYIRGYDESWNLTLEQRIKGWIASEAYVGTRAVDQQQSLQLNWGAIGGGTAGEQEFPFFGRTASTLVGATMGTNKYDAFQTKIQHPFAHGLQIGGAYTFSKAMFWGLNDSIPAYFVSKNYGPAATDTTDMFSVTAVYALPFGKGERFAQKGVASHILGGWQLSGLSTRSTGLPFTATASATSLNAPFSTQYANCLGPSVSTGNINQWYPKSEFGIPANGTYGNCGYDSLRGPGLFNLDAGLARTIPIREKFNLRFSAEMFNITNHPNHAVVNVTNASVNAGTFMQATDLANVGREGLNQRAARFSLKLNW